MRRPYLLVAFAVVAVVAVVAAIAAAAGWLRSGPTGASPAVNRSGSVKPGHSRSVILPPANAVFDYQIGGAYPPPAGVRVLSRDRSAAPASGTYSICYINAYQVQPDEAGWWRGHHDTLLLHDDADGYVVDGDWNEILFDVSTPANRAALAAIVDGWIDGCANAGFQAVEPDNLDSWTRSDGRLTKADALAFAALLSAHAHARGLAIGQKNAADIGTAGRAAGFDFAIAEECGRYSECDAYTAAYGNHVIVIEYRKTDFDTACGGWGATLSVVLRDRQVSTVGSAGYQYGSC